MTKWVVKIGNNYIEKKLKKLGSGMENIVDYGGNLFRETLVTWNVSERMGPES